MLTSPSATGASPDGSFTFTPKPDMPSDNYNFKVEDGSSKPNYSKQFQYFGASAPTTPGANSTTSAPGSSSTSTDSSSKTSSTY